MTTDMTRKNVIVQPTMKSKGLISRRTLLAGTSSALLMGPGWIETGLSTEIGDLGRICLNLNGLNYYSGFYALLNVWKQSSSIQLVADGVKYDSSIALGSPGSAWDNFLDEDGELRSPLSGSRIEFLRVFSAASVSEADLFTRAGETWILKWDGKATRVAFSDAASSRQVGNRIVWVWPKFTGENIFVRFAGIDPADPPRNIKLCEARYEPHLDAGHIFNPDWLRSVREGSGIIRFMDWQSTNFNRSTLRVPNFPSERHTKFGGGTREPFLRGGVPLAVMSKLANQVQSHPWVCIPNVLGTRKLSKIITISNAKPAIVSSPGHNWEDGDEVIPYGTNWPTLERNTFTVVNSDRKAGTLSLSGVDSITLVPYKSSWASLTAPYDLELIKKEVATLSSHFRDNVKSSLVTYFELGNEVWNGAFNAFHWFAAQSRRKFPKDNNNQMAGFLTAHCMKIIRDTYGPAQRLRWRGVIATQGVLSTYVTEQVIAGVNAYLAEHAQNLTIKDLFDVVAVNGYWGYEFYVPANKNRIFDWMEQSESHWRAGQERTKYSYFNRVVNEEFLDGRLTGFDTTISRQPAIWKAHKAIADRHKLDLVQYEGNNHGDPVKLHDILNAEEKSRLIEFWKNANHTVEDARNYTLSYNNFVAVGGKQPAKFVEMGTVSRYGAWGGLRYLGDHNPVWDAVVAFNRRS